jgi:hypothetical protein
MPVDVHRDLYAVVAKLIPDVGERFTGLDQKTCIGGTEIMYPDPSQARFLECLVKDPPPGFVTLAVLYTPAKKTPDTRFVVATFFKVFCNFNKLDDSFSIS